MIAAAGLIVVSGIATTSEPQVAGTWAGSWLLPGSPSADLVVRLESNGSQGLSGSAVSLSGGILPQLLSAVSARDSVITFSCQRGGETLRFRGRLDETEAGMGGVVSTEGSAAPGAFHLVRRREIRSNPNHLIYRGGIPSQDGEATPMTLYLVAHEGAWSGEVDLPESGVFGYPISIHAGENGVALMGLPSADGAVVTLALRPGADRMNGFWGRGQQVREVAFVRDRKVAGDRLAIPAAHAWRDRVVRVEAAGEDTLHGVLSLPAESGRFPLVILLGELGTDLNGTIDGHQLLRPWVGTLTGAGFATLRLDQKDKGFVARRRALRRWLEWIAGQDSIDRARIALLGHGDGGAIAARHAAAFGDGVSGLVLLASPGLPERINDLGRIETALRTAAATDAQVTAAIEARRQFTRMAMQQVSEDAIAQALKEWYRTRAACLGSAEEPASADYEGDLALARTADWLDRLRFDPRTVMPRLPGMPILAVQGDADTWFDGPRNLAALTEANQLRAGLIEPHLIPGLDHLLRRPSATAADIMAEEVVEQVMTWLQETIGRPMIVPSAQEGGS
jgi:pimeloyl-ACP methyl ester carboxylesterase